MAQAIRVHKTKKQAKRAVRELAEQGTYYVHVRSAAKSAPKTNRALDDLRDGVNSLRATK